MSPNGADGAVGAGGVGDGAPCLSANGDRPPGAREDWHKANGATASLSPLGDSFDVNFVAHELAHQFNVEHTWTGKLGGCTQGQFATSFNPNSQAGMELGAGNTLATYAGACALSSLQDSFPSEYQANAV